MCCGHRGQHHGGRHGRHRHTGSCGCGGASHFGRRYWAKDEKIAWLEQYLEDLQLEAKAVEERIAEMRGE
jgi:hypothetical protein